MVTFYDACRATLRECPDHYAKAYAKAGLTLCSVEEIRTQALYILCNMGHWRGPTAKECREIFKREGKRS